MTTKETHMDPLTVTLERASELTGLSVRTCRRRCDSGAWRSVTDGRVLVFYDSITSYLSALEDSRPNAA